MVVKSLHVVGVVLALCFFGALQAQEGSDAKSEAKLEAKQIVGQWVVESGVRGGAQVGQDRLGTVSISEKAFTIPLGEGMESFVMEFEIDNSQSPAHIDMDIVAGPAPPSPAKGIISYEDGKVKLCYHPMGGDRPDAFESTEDNECHYFVLTRKPLEPKDLVGTWNYVSGQRAGVDVSDTSLLGDVVFTEEQVTMPSGEEGASFVIAYKLDAEESPVAIDLEIKEGPIPSGKVKGIIKMEAGHVVFCYQPMGGDRPKDFETSEDNGCYMFKLKLKEED